MRPLRKPPLLPSSRIRIRRFGQHDTDGPTVYIFLDVLDEIIFHTRYRQGDQSAMVLTGGLFEGPAGPFVEVQGFMEAMYVGSTADWLTTLQHRYPIVRDHLQHTSPQTSVLGWMLGVPGGRATMDASALVVHLTFFNLPHQLLLAVDPISGEMAVYRRGPDGRMRNIGFNVIAQRHQVERIAAELEAESTAASSPDIVPPEPVPGPALTPAPGEVEERDEPRRPALVPDAARVIEAPMVSGELPRLGDPVVQAPGESSGVSLDESWEQALAELPEDFQLLDVHDPREAFVSDNSLSVAAEIAAAVASERERQARPEKPLRTSEDSLVSALKDIIQSASVMRAVPRPAPSFADELDTLLPPPRRGAAPGSLFGGTHEPQPLAVEASEQAMGAEDDGTIMPASAILDAISASAPLDAEVAEVAGTTEPSGEALESGPDAEPIVDAEPPPDAFTGDAAAATSPSTLTSPSEKRPGLASRSSEWEFISFGSRQNLRAVQREEGQAPKAPGGEPAGPVVERSGAGDPAPPDLDQLRRVLDVVRDALVEKAVAQSGTRWPAVSRSASAEESPSPEVESAPNTDETPDPLNKSRESGKHYAVDRNRAFIKKTDDEP